MLVNLNLNVLSENDGCVWQSYIQFPNSFRYVLPGVQYPEEVRIRSSRIYDSLSLTSKVVVVVIINTLGNIYMCMCVCSSLLVSLSTLALSIRLDDLEHTVNLEARNTLTATRNYLLIIFLNCLFSK